MLYSPFEMMIAFRYLRARKAEGFVSVIATLCFLGIMVGVAALITVMSVMNGFPKDLIGRLLGMNGHLNVYSRSGPMMDYDALLGDIRQVDGVVSVAPVIEGQVLVMDANNATGAIVRGFTQEYMRTKPLLANSAVVGDINDFTGDKVGVGIKLAEKFNITVGDKVTLMAPKGRASPFGTIPRTAQYTVGLIFDVGMHEYNSGFVFMPLDTAQIFFQLPTGAANLLEVMSDDPQKVDKIKEAISVVTAGRAGVYDWRDSNPSFFSALKVERVVMFVILTLIIFVAAFNIISSMIMLVKDKSRDIAIMRTMGAQSRSMLKIFMLTGGVVGVSGTAAGAALGILLATYIEQIRQFVQNVTGTKLFPDDVYFLSKLPSEIDWGQVVLIISISIFFSIMATIYPAWRAARLDPVEALRYE